MTSRRVLAVAALLAAGCAKREPAVPAGLWGGRNVELVVTAGGAMAQFKCGATGAIDQALRLQGGSSFAVDGIYTPRLVNSGPESARFAGSVSPPTMSLQVTVGGQSVGAFQLVQKEHGTFDVCNF